MTLAPSTTGVPTTHLVAVAAREEHVVERHLVAGLGLEGGDAKPGSGLGPELLPAGLEYRVHAGFPIRVENLLMQSL